MELIYLISEKEKTPFRFETCIDETFQSPKHIAQTKRKLTIIQNTWPIIHAPMDHYWLTCIQRSLLPHSPCRMLSESEFTELLNLQNKSWHEVKRIR